MAPFWLKRRAYVVHHATIPHGHLDQLHLAELPEQGHAFVRALGANDINNIKTTNNTINIYVKHT